MRDYDPDPISSYNFRTGKYLSETFTYDYVTYEERVTIGAGEANYKKILIFK